MKNYKTKTQTNKTVINFKLFLLKFVEIFHYDLITGSNPANINQFRSHTGKYILFTSIYSYKALFLKTNEFFGGYFLHIMQNNKININYIIVI